MVFKKIDEHSDSSVTSALDIFNIPPTNTAVSTSNYRELLSLNPIADPPFHFKIHPGSHFLDLSKCYLLTEMCIQKVGPNGNLVPVVNTDEVAPIQAVGSTFIRNMKI